MPAIRPTGRRSSQGTAVAVIADKVRSYKTVATWTGTAYPPMAPRRITLTRYAPYDPVVRLFVGASLLANACCRSFRCCAVREQARSYKSLPPVHLLLPIKTNESRMEK